MDVKPEKRETQDLTMVVSGVTEVSPRITMVITYLTDVG